MKKYLLYAKAFLLLLLAIGAQAQETVNPAIPHYGSVFNSIPGVSFKADKGLQYKVVIEIDKSDTSGAAVTQALELASRFVNLLELDGITKNKRSIVIIFHNAGSYCIQKNDVYQRKYGHPNPNLQVLDELTQAGVKLMVCGQSTVKRKLLPSDLLPQVKIATSYMTAFVTLQLKGFAGMKL